MKNVYGKVNGALKNETVGVLQGQHIMLYSVVQLLWSLGRAACNVACNWEILCYF